MELRVSDKDRDLVALSPFPNGSDMIGTGRGVPLASMDLFITWLRLCQQHLLNPQPTRNFSHKILSHEVPERNGKRKKARAERDGEK